MMRLEFLYVTYKMDALKEAVKDVVYVSPLEKLQIEAEKIKRNGGAV
jgi:hypothetical protein